MHMFYIIFVSLLIYYVPILTGEMMANAAEEAKRTLAKQNKNKRRKQKAAQARTSRQPPELDTSDSSGSDTPTHGSSLDQDGYDSDEISFSKEMPFDYQAGVKSEPMDDE